MATKPPTFSLPGGMFRALREDPLGMNLAMLDRQEPVLRARFGPFWQWAVFDADLARDVLSANAEHYPRPALVNAVFKGIAGVNVFTTKGQAWRWRRKALQPNFNRGPIEALASSLTEFVDRKVGELDAGMLADAQRWFASITISVAASATFGQDLTEAEGRRLDDAFRAISDWTGHQVRSTVPLPIWVPTALNRKTRRAGAEVRAWLAGAIAQRRASGPSEPADVLDTLLSMTDPETGTPLPDERIIDEGMVLLFAGYETTAAAATWAMAYLADRPDLQARLASGEEGLATRVIDETLRLRPPGWGAPRMAGRTMSLGGYQIRRFTPIVVPIFALHHNPRYWPDPQRFDPDRFLPENATGRPGSAFIPFLAGPRHCLGMRLAQLELHLVVEALCRRFEISGVGPVEPDATFALRVRDGLPLQLSLRSAA